MPKKQNYNKIEEVIAKLAPGQAVHLGHSAVVMNAMGVKIGLDLSSTDGWISSPFANLTLSHTGRLEHLLPMRDVQTQMPRPELLARHLDVLLYSHLHSDHFSLAFIRAAKKANPRLRVLCPPNTKQYLLERPELMAENALTRLFKEPFVNWVQKRYREEIQAFRDETLQPGTERRRLITSFEELYPNRQILIPSGSQAVAISSFFVLHPSYQVYMKMPVENAHLPAAIGYLVRFQENGISRKIILVGESAADPSLLAHVFGERDGLALIAFPVTEQSASKGLKFVEEFAAHSGLRPLAALERLVLPDTLIIPLHQGFWYFQLAEADVVRGRDALDSLGRNNPSELPFVKLTRDLQAIAKNADKPNGDFGALLNGVYRRWRDFKKLAKALVGIPIAGRVITRSVGAIVDFRANVTKPEDPQLSTEAIRAAIDSHLKEFEMLHGEIDNAWGWQKALVNYSLISIAFPITIINVFPDTQLLFIGASFVLSALGFSLLEQTIRMGRIGRYFGSTLIPRMNALILELDKQNLQSSNADKLRVLLWEKYFRGANVSTGLMGVAAAGKFILAVFPGSIAAIAFYLAKTAGGQPWTMFETAALVLAGIFSLFPAVIFVWNIRYAYTGK